MATPDRRGTFTGGASCLLAIHRPNPFELTRKRRKGFPSESRVKKGQRLVRGYKELVEKLGRNDPCPCGSGRSFQTLLPQVGQLLTARSATTTSAKRS
ncbi:MAG TPA: SEC-C metal-binding domain-containing protein [Candidatus Competibacter sp.]|nr:SEC-C metal-binding domain-containing protein [Candidatus Competibacter sp.]